MDRLHGLYRPQIVRCQNVKSQSLIRSWKSINSQSSAITINPSRLTAASLMSKHALWQIYGYMGNTAKLSPKKKTPNIFFMHFHPPQKKTSKVRVMRSKIFADALMWCSTDWDLASKECLPIAKTMFFTDSCGDPRESFITFQTVKQTCTFTLLYAHTHNL